LFQIGTILYKLRRTTKKVLFGQTVYESPGLKTPFSFFCWIVLDSSQYSKTDLQEILLHEATHAEQSHSLDTLLAELVCVFCWFNPFAWLLRTEIRMNLEFLADHSVLSSGCEVEHYQFHLLHLSYHKAVAKITNNFNVSLLKKRIFMMNKKQTSYRSIWKYALIFPALAMLLFFNSFFQTKAEPNNEMNQSQQTPQKTQDKPVAVAKKSSEIFNHVEEMPQFPCGDAALMKWLQDNMKYPEEAAKKGIQGRVAVRFVVKPDGSVEDVQVVKGLYPACDQEALRVMKIMPNWIPGKQNGNPVYVYYSLPLTFKLSGGDTDKPSTSTPPPPSAINSNQTVSTIVQIDGKTVSNEEWKNFDANNIESVSVVTINNHKILMIATKKK
jgi:TonB family protein